MTALKSKKVGAYTVKEATYKQMKPLLNSGENEDLMDSLMRQCVYDKDGNPLGDKIDEMGFQTVEKIMNAVTEVNGMTEKKN